MKYFSEHNLGRISFFGSVLLVLMLMFCLGGMHVFSSYKALEADIRFLERTFLEHQKKVLQQAVNEQMARIEVRRELAKEELNRILKARAKNILGLMENIYEQCRETKSREEIEQFLREALRPFRFQNGSGYVFIHSLDGVSQLYPREPSLKGDPLHFRAIQNSADIAREMAEKVKEQGEGGCEYQWPKPGSDGKELFRKVSFFTYFKPFDWIVGVGGYLDCFEEKIQQGVVTVLKESSVSNKGDYFFLYQLHDIQGGDDFATMLVNINRPDLVGTTVSDSYTDVKGAPFRKEMLEGLREDGEAFVEYWYKKPGSDNISRKLSYFKLYPQWNWILAKGVYFDDLEKIILLKRKQLAERLEQDLLLFAGVMVTALIVALLLASVFSGGIHNLFEQYKKRQKILQQELEDSRDQLELRVQSRTAELEDTHAQLLHAEKLAAIGSFSASIAHEFNNPLAGVLNVLSRLKRKVKLEESDEQLVAMALSECERMKRLIQNLQSFNRPSSGRKRNFDLREVIESILLLSQKELSLNHVRVETDFSPVPAMVHAVEDQIKQVLLNLIKNAMEAMSASGGLLKIGTRQEAQVVIVTICDNGSGIEDKHLEHIYEPFFTTKSIVKGTGLGLSVSYNIIKGHGGDVTVRTEPGKGTTFTLRLPLITGVDD